MCVASGGGTNPDAFVDEVFGRHRDRPPSGSDGVDIGGDGEVEFHEFVPIAAALMQSLYENNEAEEARHWCEITDDLGRRVYYNKKTGKETFVKPEILKKVDKLQEPPPVKAVRALPAPMDAPRKKRGGRRVRQMKERALDPPMDSTIDRNFSRFLPRSMASTSAPISSTPNRSRTPDACRAMAVFSAV